MSVRKFSKDDPDYDNVRFHMDGVIGRLSKVRRIGDAKEMVRYEVKLSNAEGAGIFHREIMRLRTLKECRYILLWEDESFDPDELMMHIHIDWTINPEITLEGFINLAKTAIRKEIVAVIINTLAKALVDCHQKGVYHGDVRPKNILLAKKEFNGITITVAYLMNFESNAAWEVASDQSGRETSLAEKQCYMAPEALDPSNPTFSAKSDVFALGCTMYHLCSRKRPYENGERANVPELAAVYKNFYGNSVSPMPGSLMQLEADKRPDMETFSATMQAYCEARGVKLKAQQKSQQAWVGAGVQVLGAVAAAHNPALAGVIGAATKATVQKVMTPEPAPAPGQAPAQAQAQVPLEQSQVAPPVLARGLPQSEPSASVSTLPQSSGIGLPEIIEALLEVRSRARLQCQPGAEFDPQASGLSPEDLALAQEILLILLEKCCRARPQSQAPAQVYPQAPGPTPQASGQASQAPGLAPGWGELLSEALPHVLAGVAQHHTHTGVQHHPQTSGLLHGHHHKKHPIASLPQPQTHKSKATDEPQAAAQTPTPAQQAAYQLALQRQQAQWQNFGAMMNTQSNATNQIMAATYASDRQTLENANSMYQNQAQQQSAQFQQTHGMSDANRHLNAQAFGQAIQGNDVLVFPAYNQSPYFYGGV